MIRLRIQVDDLQLAFIKTVSYLGNYTRDGWIRELIVKEMNKPENAALINSLKEKAKSEPIPIKDSRRGECRSDKYRGG
jgi:hypothetical protein